MKKTQVLVIGFPNSNRIARIKKRLRFLKIKHKIIPAVDGKKLIKNPKNLSLTCDTKKIKNFYGRKLSAPEIGASASHIKCYQYIIKNNIENCIIMEDDAYPSIILKKWINKRKNFKEKSIISFFAYPSGFVNKKPVQKIFNKTIYIHLSKTHLFSSLCYQINIKTCKKLMSITGGKASISDWPFNFKQNKIKLLLTIPFMAIESDYKFSYLQPAIKKEISHPFIKRRIYNNKYFYEFLSSIYYIFFIPYIFKKYENLDFYIEFFFIKKLAALKNIFSNSYIEVKKIYQNLNYYAEDLHKIYLKRKGL